MKFLFTFLSLFYLTVCSAREIHRDVQDVLRESILVDVKYKQNSSSSEKVFGSWYEDVSEYEGLTFSPGIVSQACLRCICLRESSCTPLGCVMDVGSLSCGYFQIKEAYWIDCGKPGTGWKTCANDVACSSACVQNYMKRYARHYGCHLTCEGFAREHNGGPKGCLKPSTWKYWLAVENEPGCKGVNE